MSATVFRGKRFRRFIAVLRDNTGQGRQVTFGPRQWLSRSQVTALVRAHYPGSTLLLVDKA